MKVVRVVIGDDDGRIREALTELLEADRQFVVVGTAATGAEVVDRVRATRPDVVLLDVRMPGGGPLAAAAVAELGQGSSAGSDHHPGPAVIGVSAQTGVATVLAMVEAGAVGFLAKGNLDALPELVARCARGEVVLAVPGGADALRQLAHRAADRRRSWGE